MDGESHKGQAEHSGGEYASGTVKQAPSSSASLPFADTTNRTSVFFQPPSTTSSWNGEGQTVGLGRPLGQDAGERRDVTVKPPRRHAPFPPSAASPPVAPEVEPVTFPSTSITSASLSQSSGTTKHPSRPTHHTTASLSAIPSSFPSAHPSIPSPIYPVRSQRLSTLTSSTSLSRSLSQRSNLADPETVPLSPTISGGLVRRLSLSSLSGSDGEGDIDEMAEEEAKRMRRIERPLARRSESLPSFPPPEVIEAREREERERNEQEGQEKRRRELECLPPNPKLWLPSHLALYISYSLLLPPQLSSDITTFIRTSRLSGRTFLRLRDAEFAELGVNVRWRSALSKARDELLAAVAAGGGVNVPLWGFEGGQPSAEQPPEEEEGGRRKSVSLEVEGSADEDERGKEEWKRSWRAMGRNTPGRVRGLREAFETGHSAREGRGSPSTVDEVSEPGSSPQKGGESKMANGERRRWKDEVKGWRMSWALQQQQDGEGGGGGRHGRTESMEGALSAASVDSAGGRYDTATSSSRRKSGAMLFSGSEGDDEQEEQLPPSSPPPDAAEEEDLFRPSRRSTVSSITTSTASMIHPRHPSLSNSDRGLPFPFSTPEDTPPSSSFLRRPTTISTSSISGDRDTPPVPLLELDLASPPLSPSPSTSSFPSSSLAFPPPTASGEGYQASISSHAPSARPYAPVRRPSYDLRESRDGTLTRAEGRKGSGAVKFTSFSGERKREDNEGDEDEDEGRGEPTVRPPRGGSGSGSGSMGEWGLLLASPVSEKPPGGGLAELFGLDVPKTRKGEDEGGRRGEGLATLFVPGEGAAEGRGGRKGSLVLVKKSQLAALHRRIDEVESLVASASSGGQGRAGASPPSYAGDRTYEATYRGLPEELKSAGVKEVELGEEGHRVESLAARARQLTSSSVASSSTPSSSPAYSPRSSVLRSSTSSHGHAQDTSLSSISSVPSSASKPRRRHRRREPSTDSESEGVGDRMHWPEGWRQLSGYVVAASIGIGIVAGEVVLTQLFGRRR
ncbi:hypothetical protein JCM8547_005069 [Rhodosporidiobolus lusitaniae]